MIYLEEKKSNLSTLIENQFPDYVQQYGSKFINFLTSYYESQEGKYQPLDLATNLIEYYNVSYYRPHQLVESTELTENLFSGTNTIPVKSTVGFPKTNGYIQIDNEIIFYRTKTDTSFEDCFRGTTALVLENYSKSNIVLKNTTAAEHEKSSVVRNVAYNYANEFFSRIKKEIAPLIPKNLVDELDIASFLTKIKTFYSAKGSLNSHRILFRILFNDRKFNIVLKSRGVGAKIKTVNYGGSLPDPQQVGNQPEIVSGGTGYDNRKDENGKLISPPIIDVLGTGTGQLINGLRPNKTAVIEVVDIDQNGSIVEINVTDIGDNYTGPITARVRGRFFEEDQVVYSVSGNGTGKVEYFDPENDELILYDVIGFFRPNEEIYALTGEAPRAFIAKSYIPQSTISGSSQPNNTLSREGLVVKSEEQQIEFPRDYTFKTSSGGFTEKVIMRVKLLPGFFFKNDEVPSTISFKQETDRLFGVNGVNIEVDDFTQLDDDVFEFEISSNTDLDDMYLQPTTVVTKSLTGLNANTDPQEFVVTVDDASRFPVTNGIIFVNGHQIEYETRSFNQFFNCRYKGSALSFDLSVKDEVISFGRLKYTVEWKPGESINIGDFRFYEENLYVAETHGISGSLPPVHDDGVKRDGLFELGDVDPVSWRYYDRTKFIHAFYIDYEDGSILNPRFQLIAMPGDVVVESSGSLHTKSTYEFAKFDDPNIKMYNFTTSEISDRLSSILATNFNRTRTTVDDPRLSNSYKSLTGFTTQHDFQDYIYVVSSGIPPWWNDIVDLSDLNKVLSAEESKKVGFSNQKIVSRWNKSGLINETQAFGERQKTKKLIGLNIDAIQVNSYKGNTVNYGKVNTLTIANGGTYPVPYKDVTILVNDIFSGVFDDSRYPSLDVQDPQNSSKYITEDNTSGMIALSTKIEKINFNKLAEFWDGNGNLTGFTSRPSITVTNNNFNYSAQFEVSTTQGVPQNGYIDTVNEELILTNHDFKTAEVVTFVSDYSHFDKIFLFDELFVRKIDDDRIALFKTRNDCLLNNNRIDLSFNIVAQNTSEAFDLVTEQRNPADFEEAELELSYNNGTIDNILIRNSGNGYIVSPKITISGGGKSDDIIIPLQLKDSNDNLVRIVEMSGSLISAKNYDIGTGNQIDGDFNQTIFDNLEWGLTPKIVVNNGKGARAVAYVANGKIVSIVLLDSGSNYAVPPIVEVYGEGENAVIETEINDDGEVTGFNIINPGEGFFLSPRLEIVPVGSGGSISARLNEWTFNLVRQLGANDRIDSYGGYVYHNDDEYPQNNNDRNFQVIDYDLDFANDLDRKQYRLFTTSEKLLAKYTIEKTPEFLINNLKQQILVSDPTRDFNQNPLTENEIFGSNLVHSPAITVSYDSIPVYGGKSVYTEKNLGESGGLSEITSRYRLKYSTTNSNGAESYVVNGTTYYVNRDGGPSVSEYPIGSFIEDYEFVPGGENDLDEHNGRYGLTPEFLETGRYCYFVTYKSFDDVTNSIIDQQNSDRVQQGLSEIKFNGFPYVIGDTFASTNDDYMNGKCRTNDKIPKFFTRIYENNVDSIVQNIPPFGDVTTFPGLSHNDEYPQEDTRKQRSILTTEVLSPGSVDSVIIEASGDGYRVGDRLDVDNYLSFGSGFSGFVSKVKGKPITGVTKLDEKTVTFSTDAAVNGFKVGDYAHFDYETPENPIAVDLVNPEQDPLTTNITNNTEISIFTGQREDFFKDKTIYNIDLNFKHVYKLNLPSTSFSFTYDLDKINEFFVNPSNIGTANNLTYVILDVQKIPNRLYLHIGNNIFQLNKSRDYFGPRKIISVDNELNRFTVQFPESTLRYSLKGLVYNAKAYGAEGPIAEISISNKGFNYRKLPVIRGLLKRGTTDEPAGNGEAIIQANSNTIGTIQNIKYVSVGGGLTSNLNTNYYLNVPSTAKVINNFEIYDVEIINAGELYNTVTEVVAKENGVKKETKIIASVSLGRIVDIEVIDGGSNFSKTPTLEVVAPQGQGAVLKAKIRRKEIFPGTLLSVNDPENLSTLFPIIAKGTTVSFDVDTSTLEYDEINGEFKDNNLVYTDDGRPYGRIVSVRKTKAYAKVSPYAKLTTARKDIKGNISEYLQKITDSNYYQDWSYTIVSSRDTIEWKKDQTVNTHAAGFKQFGKKLIERRKLFYQNPLDLVNSSVIFTTRLANDILLRVKTTPCQKQTIALLNIDEFEVGDFIFGSVSEAIGEVVKKGEYSLVVALRNGVKFKVNEYIVKIPNVFAFGIQSATARSLLFWNGIMQEPEESYETAFSYYDQSGNALNVPVVGTVIPKFDLLSTDEVVHYKFTDITVDQSGNIVLGGFDVLDTIQIGPSNNLYFPSKEGETYNFSSDFLNHTIISIGGAVQNPATMTANASEKYIRFNDIPNYDAKLFAVTSNTINLLTFTGPSSGTTFTIDQTPSDDCNLLIFYSGLNQSQLLTDFTVSGNTVTFSVPVELENIFGWYIDETIECEKIDVQDLLDNRLTGVRDCVTRNFTEFIHSSAVKHPESIYEIRKEYIDGTIYPDSDGTTLYGFDTRFTYTSPEYSTSFVEVLDRVPFDGTTKSFTLTSVNKHPYTPANGKDSLVVYVNNQVLDNTEYQVSGNTILFNTAYASSSDCTILDFNSKHIANQSSENGADLDKLDVQHNSIRKRFNLSDVGVPQYVKNVGDVFHIGSGVLQRPDARNQSVDKNKITFIEAPSFKEDTTELIYFNRQLLPLPTKNVVLDDFICFDGVRTDFPLTLDGLNFYPVNVYHLFIVRNGVYQKAGIDYRLATTSDYNCPAGLDCYPLDGSHLIFSEPPKEDDVIIVFYSYDGLNQNFGIDSFKYFNGVETTFALTKDFVSETPVSVDHIQVYRNGVYQYSDVDYSIQTSNGGPRITFATAPDESETVYITEFNTSNYFENKTSEFSQVSPSIIEYTNSSPFTSADVLLIYKNGLLIQDGYTIDYGNQTITFDENFTIDSLTRIFLVSNCQGLVDKFFKFDGVTDTFPLTKDIVSKAPHSESHIQVYRNGIYQYPSVDYTVQTSNGGPRITFTTAPVSSDSIWISNFHSTSHFAEVTSQFTQISPTEFQYSGTLGSNFLFIFKDGVIQVGNSYSFNQNTQVLTFSESIDLNVDKLIIHAIGNQVKELDSFYDIDGVNKVFPISYFYDSINVLTPQELQVYRNGVYQLPGIDYVIGNFTSGNKYVEFSTAPTTADNIFINQVSNTTNFEDITNNFVQSNSTTLGNISTLDPTKTLLIYNQGVLQNSDAFVYNYTNEELVFTDPFTLTNDVKIYAIANSNGVLDGIYEFDGITTTFPLTFGDISYTPAVEYQIQVYRNGVYQYPTTDYSISTTNGGPRINFVTAPATSDNIFITAFNENEIDDLTSNVTQQSATELLYSGAANISQGTLLIYVDGLIQVGNAFTISNNIISFAAPVDILVNQVKILHVVNTVELDRPMIFDGLTTTFPLTKDNLSISQLYADNTLVYRNGVYQYPSTDYTISVTNGGPRIEFTIAPTSSENVFIQLFETGSGFNDITSSFTTINGNTLQYSGTLSPSALLIFKDGVMQIGDSWIYDTTNQRLVFSESVIGQLRIIQIDDCPVIINNLISTDTDLYPLKNGRKPYYPNDTESLLVCIDGVVQRPGISYQIEGSNLRLLDPNILPGQRLYVVDAYNSNLMSLDNLETTWIENGRKYLKMTNNYQTVITTNLNVVREGVVQDITAFDTNGSVFSIIDIPQSDWNKIRIYDGTTSGFIRIDYLGTIISTSPAIMLRMFKNYQTISAVTDSLIVNLNGVVQNPSTIYDSSNTLLTINDNSFDIYNMEVVDASGCGLRIVDRLSDYYDEFVGSDGYVHSRYILRTVHPEMLNSYGALVSYGGTVQQPDVGYKVYVENNITIFELITPYGPNLDELYIFDVSKTAYESYDSLESLISVNGDNYTVRISENYQTISGLTDEETLVHINGVVQEVGSYDVINSTITLIGSNYESAKVYDLSGANLRTLDYLSEDFTTPTFKLLNNYTSFTPSSVADVFLLRESVLQNPTEDYVVGTGYITFTTQITKTSDIFMKYVHTTQEVIPLTDIPFTVCTNEDTYTLPYAITDPENCILYLNGVPGFHGVDFNINGNVLSFTSGAFVDDGGGLFLVKYSNIQYIDNLESCPDGVETRFKLLYQGKNIFAESSADVLTNREGMIQNPDVDYNVDLTTVNGNSIAKFINFVTPLQNKDIFFVRMYGNKKINLTSIGGSNTDFTTTDSITDYDNVYIFANGNWVLPTEDYSVSNTTFVLQNPAQTPVFAIEFDGIVKVLDEVHTPYDSVRKLFNMFINEENFVPNGTIENDNTPDETSVLVFKNGLVLDPKIDYVLNGDIKSQIEFSIAPQSTDIINVKTLGSFLKLDTITSGFTGSENEYSLKLNSENYYPNAEIERPREHENQILVIKDSVIQSPIFDYYIDNNKIVFLNNIPSSTNKIVVMDFRGTQDDVKVFNRFNQLSVGDEIRLDGAKEPRYVTEVISPTLAKTSKSETSAVASTEAVHYGFSGTATYQDGKVTTMNVTNGGKGYTYPTIVRTKGTGTSAKSLGNINYYEGGALQDDLEIQYPGFNIYRDQDLYATVYGTVYKKLPLHKSQVRRATKLSQSINDSIETLELANTTGLSQNPPVVQVSSETGSGAQFRVYVSKNSVRKIEILNPGSGYDEITFKVELLGGGGTGCVLEGFLDANGSITDVIVRNGGEGYDTFRVIVCDDDATSNSNVDAEFIEYTYVDGNTLRGCTRISGSNHSQDDYVYFDGYL